MKNSEHSELQLLLDKMTEVSVKKGDLIIEQFSLGDTFYYIKSGSVRVWKYLDPSKEEVLDIGDLGAGEYFGEIALIDSAPRTVNITAQEDSLLFVLTRTSFYELIETNPKTTLTILKILTARIRNSEQRENTVLIEKNKHLITKNKQLGDALKELKKNEEIRLGLMEELKKQNETLEEMVKERTAKLMNSLKIIQEDLETAKTIQRNILPLGIRKIAQLDFSSAFEPMSEVGGDVFDVVRIGDSKIRLFLADAIGHGVQAALITMAIKAEFDHLKFEAHTPADVLYSLNQIFIDRYGKKSNQFTAVIVDAELSKNEIVYACAGHNDPYIISKNNIIPLTESGVMLGLEKDVEYLNYSLPFQFGDSLFMISDGYLEQENDSGEFLGEQNLLEIFRASMNQNLNLSQTVDYLMERFHTFRGKEPMMDDVTILGIGTRVES